MFSLEEIGLTKKEIQERVIDRIASTILVNKHDDEDGGECYYKSKIADKLHRRMEEYIDNKISRIADEMIKPNIEKIIENAVFEKTNSWGERTREPSFNLREYLLKRVNDYLLDEVDSKCQSRAENGGYSFTKAGSRINVLIKNAIGTDIDKAIKKFMSDAMESLSLSIGESIDIHLKSIKDRIKKA